MSSLGVFRFLFPMGRFIFSCKMRKEQGVCCRAQWFWGWKAMAWGNWTCNRFVSLQFHAQCGMFTIVPSNQIGSSVSGLWLENQMPKKQKNKTEHGWLGLGVLIPTNPSPNPQTPPKCSSPSLSGEGYSLFIILTHVSHSCDDEGNDCHTSDSPHYDGHHELFWKSV